MSTSRRRRSTRRLTAAAVLASATLAACGGGGSGGDGGGTDTGTPVPGGTLKIAFWSSLQSCFDPNQVYVIETRSINRNFADSLTDQDPETGKIVPWLAKSWKVNPDATEYTFVLRDGVTFSDGTPLDANAVGVGIAPGFARTTRAEVFRVRGQAYVEAARTGGASWGRVLLRHVLPNSWGPVAVLAVLDFGTAVLAISALSFLGFGAAPPAAEWGTLISSGRNYLITSPWLSLLPGLFVGLVVFSLNHIARTLEEVRRWQ
ncbi:ABC transporter permease [Parafrankia soli]|uniref:ABC transporter permease n=1 Tax=Parafrankia soli TaxID=2599596 RepID=UPI0009F49F1D|nr:ABC transporter permease [Parafrankia soli]